MCVVCVCVNDINTFALYYLESHLQCSVYFSVSHNVLLDILYFTLILFFRTSFFVCNFKECCDNLLAKFLSPSILISSE